MQPINKILNLQPLTGSSSLSFGEGRGEDVFGCPPPLPGRGAGGEDVLAVPPSPLERAGVRLHSVIARRPPTKQSGSQETSSIVKALKYTCVLLFTIHYSLFTNAQVTATFKGDSTQIEIGDHLHMKLVVNARPGYLIDFPQFGDSIGPNIEVVAKDKVDKVALGNDTIYSQNIVISAYEEGRYFINPLRIYTKNKSTGAIDSVYTNDFQLIVTTVKVDTSKPIRPIKAPLKVEYKLNEFTWWIVALVVLLVAAIVGFILYRRYKNKPAAVVSRPRPKEPAHIWANKELKKLDQERLWQSGDVKLYHSRLTDILRLYLEYRFNYYAMEATTEEIMTKAYDLDINMETGAKLRAILSLADFVKFAKMNPAPDQNTKSMQDAIDFVDSTKPVEEVTIAVKK